MATILAETPGDVSVAANWVGGVAPVADDIVDFNGKVMVLDIARWPVVAGAFAGFINTVSGGRLTVALNVLGDCSIHSLSMSPSTAGNYAAFITVTGAAPTKVLTYVGPVIAGTTTGRYGINNQSTGGLHITGTVTGGSVDDGVGIRSDAGASVTVIGNLLGGNGGNAHGMVTGAATVVIIGNLTGGNGLGCRGALIVHGCASLTITADTITGGEALGVGFEWGRQFGGTFVLTFRVARDSAGARAFNGRGPTTLNVLAGGYYQLANGTRLWLRKGMMNGGIAG